MDDFSLNWEHLDALQSAACRALVAIGGLALVQFPFCERRDWAAVPLGSRVRVCVCACRSPPAAQSEMCDARFARGPPSFSGGAYTVARTRSVGRGKKAPTSGVCSDVPMLVPGKHLRLTVQDVATRAF